MDSTSYENAGFRGLSVVAEEWCAPVQTLHLISRRALHTWPKRVLRRE
jgi:hypothetical protein